MNRLIQNLSRAAATTVFAAALAAPATSQSIDGQVVRNPNDTVTYTIDLAGPPRGQAALLISPFLLQAPIHVPGMGNLWLDPTFLLPTAGILLDPLGHGQLQFTLDPIRTLNQPLFFQPVFLDMQLTGPAIRLANNALGLNQQVAPAAVNPDSFAAGLNVGQGCGIQVWGQPGCQYTIIIRDPQGRVVAQRNVAAGPNGTTGYQGFAIPGIGAGYTYEVWKDIGHGHVTQVWSGTF